VPLHLRNAPTQLMKGLGYGEHYRYAHDETDGFAAGERYLPDLPAGMPEPHFYEPVPRGLEQRIAEKLADWRTRNAASRSSTDRPDNAPNVADNEG
jgi:putative ATPase